MSREKQIDMITELLIDFDEMGFIPTTTVPDPEAYAIEWRNRITEALRNEFEQQNAENETLRICLKDQRGRNAELQKLNNAYAKQCEEYEAELNQMHNFHADVAPKSEGGNVATYPSSAFECSNCHWQDWDLLTADSAYNFCPNCGAKMKGGK